MNKIFEHESIESYADKALNQLAEQSPIGKSYRRKEDARFITGQGRYVDDHQYSDQLYAYFVRSPYAHANILSIDVSEALKMPGIVAIYTGKQMLDAGIGAIPCGWLIYDKDGRPMAEPPHYPLAINTVRHVGEPVAVVIAQKLVQAMDAGEAVEIDYEPLDAVVSAKDAASSTAPLVWEHLNSNICCDWHMGNEEAVNSIFDSAPKVSELVIHNNRLVPAPMEPKAAIANYVVSMGELTLYTTSQNPHTIRTALATTILNIPESKMRVISPDVGGAFGTKIFLYPEETTVC